MMPPPHRRLPSRRSRHHQRRARPQLPSCRSSTPTLRELVARKDASALNKLGQLQRAMASHAALSEAAAHLDTWRYAGVGEDVLQSLASGGGVSREEYEATARLKQQLFRDKSWVRNYLDGGRKEREQMSLILSSQIRDAT
jgi:hypothetical protein